MASESLAKRFGVRLPAGAVVFRQGDDGGSMYVIRSGRVRVVKETNGRYRVITELGQGEFFGEMAVFTGRPRTATVQVVEEAELLRVPADKLQEMVTGAGEVAIRLLRRLAERLDQANRLIDILVEDDPSIRVILELQHTSDGTNGATLDTTAEELALKLGIPSREAQEALQRLARVGLVTESARGGMVVTDEVRLGDFLEFIRAQGAH